ncbi:MAG TPA: PEP-CTERM sorting domain-containing protein, partial [Phormidium sp.]
VVVGMSHTYESLVTVFPDGQAIQANLDLLPSFNPPPETLEDFQKMLETRKQLVDVRAADARFVLDQLEQINANDPKGLLAGILDLDNVGIYGHSIGGVTVPEVLRSDSRFKAGLSLDSDPFLGFEHAIPEGLDQAYMIVSDRNNSANYDNVDEFFASLGLRNDGYSVAIGGMGHGNFSDNPLLSPLLLANGFPPERLQLGSIDPLLGTQVANAYNRAFFDRYLKNINSPLLQGALPDGMNQEDITFVKVSPATSIPEPSTTVTLFGLAGLGLLTTKRKKTC